MGDQNEHLRLIATYFNSMAASIFVTGIIAPSATLILTNSPRVGALVSFFVVMAVLSIFFHLVAHAILRELVR